MSDNERLDKIPYYWDIQTNKLTYPWHYMFFKSFNWYRNLVGGKWERVNPDGSCYFWMRFKDTP